MMIYEVNLRVNKNIFKEFYAWLQDHARELLALPGFETCMIYEQVDDDSKAQQTLVVHYDVASMFDLENYFINHATEKRQAVIQKFGNQIVTTRRLLQKIESIN